MYRLAKLLFPGHPSPIRYRKLRALGVALSFGMFASLALSAAIFLLNRAPIP